MYRKTKRMEVQITLQEDDIYKHAKVEISQNLQNNLPQHNRPLIQFSTSPHNTSKLRLLYPSTKNYQY